MTKCDRCEEPCETMFVCVDRDGDGSRIYEDRSNCCGAEVYEEEVEEEE